MKGFFVLTRFLPQISLRSLRKLDCHAKPVPTSLENAIAKPQPWLALTAPIIKLGLQISPLPCP
jgi:hypothetical protein